MSDGTTITVYGHGGDVAGGKSYVMHEPTTGTTISVMANAYPVAWGPVLELAGQLFSTTQNEAKLNAT